MANEKELAEFITTQIFEKIDFDDNVQMVEMAEVIEESINEFNRRENQTEAESTESEN
jgi:hypothetical protein